MNPIIHGVDYPITLVGSLEYWSAKPAFKMYRSRFNVWIMLAIESGRFSYKVDSAFGEASAGDILLVPPNLPFYREIIEPLTFFYTCFVYNEEASPVDKNLLTLLHNPFCYKFTPPEQDRLFNNFRHLRKLHNENDPLSHRWATHYINDIWIMICIEIKYYMENEYSVRDALIVSVKEWIDRHAFDDLKMMNVSERFGLHAVALTRRFQKVFGISPSRYLLSVRMERAKTLLIQTNYTLDHIAQLCGYDNGYYFSRVFTKYSKMNPSVFRKTHASPDL